MTQDISPNKINEAQKKEIEKEKERLMRTAGMGRDEAEKRATEAVAAGGNTGGTNAGGDPPKHVNHQGDTRTGTDSNASK